MEEKKCQIKSQDFRKSRGIQDRIANMLDNREEENTRRMFILSSLTTSRTTALYNARNGTY